MTREEVFMLAPIYMDRKGYVWQKMRNGLWRSTDGAYMSDGVPLDMSGEMPPAEWGPYIKMIPMERP